MLMRVPPAMDYYTTVNFRFNEVALPLPEFIINRISLCSERYLKFSAETDTSRGIYQINTKYLNPFKPASN